MRSMIRLKRMIDTANGHTPAPFRPPTATLSMPKSVANGTSHKYMRVKNANDVVISATKHPQKTSLLFLSSTSASLYWGGDLSNPLNLSRRTLPRVSHCRDSAQRL